MAGQIRYDNELIGRFGPQRVQLGMPLKEGEKLQSLGGAWPAWILSLVKNYVEKEGTLADLIDWDTARGAAFQHLTLVVHLHLSTSNFWEITCK